MDNKKSDEEKSEIYDVTEKIVHLEDKNQQNDISFKTIQKI